MKMTNYEIYNIAKVLSEAFGGGEQYLPIKINFFIQKNKNTLTALAQDIDNSRIEIVRNYGNLNEETDMFEIPDDKIAIANQELVDLFNIEQEVNIHKINIENLPDDLSLTTAQMEALMFMFD